MYPVKSTKRTVEGQPGWSPPRRHRAAYDTLLRDCIPFIQRVARAKGVPSDFVDDVVQETLLTIHQARQTYDPSRSFTAWLRTIAQRRAIDGLRRGGRTQTAKLIRHSLIKVMLIRAGIPSKQHSKSVMPKCQFDHRQTPDQAARGGRASCAPGPIAHAGCNGDWTVHRIPSGQLDRALKTLRARLGGKD